MKNRILITTLCILMAISAMASSEFGQLEKVLSDRASYVSLKEKRIDSIKSILNPRMTVEEQMKHYDDLYQEYLTFRFDSAMAYLDRAERLIGDNAGYEDKAIIKIHRALSLATSGHVSEAIEILRGVDSTTLSLSTRRELYSAMQWTYAAWGEYSGNTSFGAKYNELSIRYLDSLLTVTDKSTPEYCYYYADKVLRQGEYKEARDSYIKALEPTPQNTRLYAQAAYGLAMSYRGMGDMGSYRRWLINAAVSDQIIPLKENLALQELALDIRNRDGDLERANRFLKYSLEDAIFYNNRLRMLEITGKIPDIALGYQDTVTSQNKRLKVYVSVIGILLLILAVSVYLIVREKKMLGISKQELSKLNSRLTALNEELAHTNVSREQYVSLFMDLCAAYIEKLNRFQSTVSLKLKTRQFDDLQRVVNNTRPSEAEMREIFFNFDTAFLRLYPDFIEKFNTLLQPDKVIIPKPNELLNTDLRIFALIRMGIKDSTKIATLLFYSPQTIFNHRTQVRNRAKNRDTFERDLFEICTTMPSGK